MRKKLFNILVIILTFIVLFFLLFRKELVYNSVIYALNAWLFNLIPALFPFFIISDIFINYDIISYIPNFLKQICKHIFNMTDGMFTIFILSMFSGFPSNARNTRILYDKGILDIDECNHILMFSHFSNPIFILTTVGTFFLKNEKVGLIILFSHFVGNFILGFLIRNKFSHTDKSIHTCSKTTSFGNIIINSIKSGIDNTLLICGILVIFMVLSSIFVSIFNFNAYNSMLVKGVFEITIGIESLGKLDLNLIYKTVIATSFLSFGGLSIHMQVMAQIVDTKIKYNYFLLGRVWQALISGIISYFIILFCN